MDNDCILAPWWGSSEACFVHRGPHWDWDSSAHSHGLLIDTPFVDLPLHPALLPCPITGLPEQVTSPKSLSKHLFLWKPNSSFTFLSPLPTRRDQSPSFSLQGPGWSSPKSASLLCLSHLAAQGPPAPPPALPPAAMSLIRTLAPALRLECPGTSWHLSALDSTRHFILAAFHCDEGGQSLGFPPSLK